MEVLGVLMDFHYEFAAREIEPLMFTANSNWIRNIPVRMVPEAGLSKTLAQINQTIKFLDSYYIINHHYPTKFYFG